MSIENEPEILDKYNQLKSARNELLKLKEAIPSYGITDAFMEMNKFNRVMKVYNAALVKFDNLVKTKLNRIQYSRFKNVMLLLKDGL